LHQGAKWSQINVPVSRYVTCKVHNPPHTPIRGYGPLHQVIQACGEDPDANLQANISALLLRRPMITQCITGTDDIVAQQLRERGSNTT